MNKSGYDSRLNTVEIQKKRAYLALLIMTAVILLLSIALVFGSTKRSSWVGSILKSIMRKYGPFRGSAKSLSSVNSSKITVDWTIKMSF